MTKKPSLSIVIPCYNEEQRMKIAINGAVRAAEASGRETEVIFIDDGSTDDTYRIGCELISGDDRISMVKRPHQGKGGAIKAGVALCSGDVIVTADADWSMPPEQVVRFLEVLDKHSTSQIVIASREIDGSMRYGEPTTRHIIGRVFNVFVRVIILPDIQDSQCGFKAYRDQAAKTLFADLNTTGWAFDVEILAKARRLGMPINEIPIDWRYDGDSRLNTTRDALTMTLAVIRLRLKMRRD
jgi:dolichyl-phosphate beta-glucosyltransferase